MNLVYRNSKLFNMYKEHTHFLWMFIILLFSFLLIKLYFGYIPRFCSANILQHVYIKSLIKLDIFIFYKYLPTSSNMYILNP